MPIKISPKNHNYGVDFSPTGRNFVAQRLPRIGYSIIKKQNQTIHRLKFKDFNQSLNTIYMYLLHLVSDFTITPFVSQLPREEERPLMSHLIFYQRPAADPLTSSSRFIIQSMISRPTSSRSGSKRRSCKKPS